MDWRLQGAAIVAGVVLCATPLLAGTQPYPGAGDAAVDGGAFAAAWNNTASVMTYPLIASLALSILGVAWQGPMRQMYAWILAATSFSLGCFNLYSLAWVVFFTYDYPDAGLATVSAQNLLTIGLSVPTLGFFSTMIWLFRVGRRNPKPVMLPPGSIRDTP